MSVVEQIDKLQNLILDSIKQSDLFDTDTDKTYTIILLDMYMSKNNGLENFVNNHDITRAELVQYAKDRLIELHNDNSFYIHILKSYYNETITNNGECYDD